jgi:hypothetical protein
LGPFEYVLDFLYARVPVEGQAIVEGQGLVVALTYRLITLLIAALGIFYYSVRRFWCPCPRSRALRGNAILDAPRPSCRHSILWS